GGTTPASALTGWCSSCAPRRRQLVQRSPRLTKVYGVEPLGEPTVDFREGRPGAFLLARPLEHAPGDRCPQLEQPGVHLAGLGDGALHVSLGCCVVIGRQEQKTLETEELRL